MNFGQRLNSAILNKHKNISEFVEETGIGRGLVDTYLKGRSTPSIKKVSELAAILDVTAAWLAYGVNDINDDKENEIIDLINIIHERIDLYLTKNNKEMDSSKKSILVKILYNQFKEQELSKDKIIEKINNAISILDVA